MPRTMYAEDEVRLYRVSLSEHVGWYILAESHEVARELCDIHNLIPAGVLPDVKEISVSDLPPSLYEFGRSLKSAQRKRRQGFAWNVDGLALISFRPIDKDRVEVFLPSSRPASSEFGEVK